MEWRSRLKQFLGFLTVAYDSVAKTVVVALRLDAAFLQGALVAAILLTLFFQYGSMLRMVWKLLRSSFWFWFGLAVVLVILVAAIRQEARIGAGSVTGFWRGISRLIRSGTQGTAVLCLVLLSLLSFLMWMVFHDTPRVTDPVVPSQGRQAQSETRSRGEETPRVWREALNERRP